MASLDWTAIFTGALALTAVLAIFIQAKWAHVAIKVQLTRDLERNFYYDETMLGWRQKAARALQQERGAPEIFEILNFFDTVGLFLRRNLIDDDLTFSNFASRAVCYWQFALPLIKKEREKHGFAWNDYEHLVDRMTKRMHRRGYSTEKEVWLELLERETNLHLRSQTDSAPKP